MVRQGEVDMSGAEILISLNQDPNQPHIFYSALAHVQNMTEIYKLAVFYNKDTETVQTSQHLK